MAQGLFRKIDCLQIPVPDIGAGLRFYRDCLGHALIWRSDTEAGLRLAAADSELVLQTARPALEVNLLVASVDEAVTTIDASGGSVVVPPFDIPIGRCAVAHDPWGNRLVLLDCGKGLLVTDAEGHVIGVRRDGDAQAGSPPALPTAARPSQVPDVRVVPVPLEDKQVLRNLMELCQHDYSEFELDEVDAHGLFGYRYLDHYWTDPARHPFLIHAGGNIAGFALVRGAGAEDPDAPHTISEFFVLSRYRRRGVGGHAARQIIGSTPGRWVIRQALANLPAQAFWGRVVAALPAGGFQERRDDRYNILEFDVDGRL